MRRFVLVALTLAALGVPVPVTNAGTVKPTGTLTVKAPKHARLLVTLAKPVTFWLDTEGDTDGPIIAGGGKHAGFLLVAKSVHVDTVGMVRVPAAARTSIQLLAGDNARPTLPAGRYTLEVVADQAIDIRVRIRGMASMTWRATGPLSVRTVNATFTSDPGPESSGTGAFTLSASSAVFTVAMFRATGVTVSAQWCVTRAIECSGGGVVQNSITQSSRPLVDQEIGANFYLAPRELPAGSWKVGWALGADALIREPTAYALIVG